MVRAFSSLGCAELELEEVLDLARQHELTAVELRADGYDHVLGLEYVRKWHPHLPTLSRALAAAEGWW